ncbi:hypothetical protein SAMN02744778_02355 [Pantoea sp. GL120224-02]|nr:hypothetical protein SAMN02744778_02355 [Pantoea sp. GL120224-02]
MQQRSVQFAALPRLTTGDAAVSFRQPLIVKKAP